MSFMKKHKLQENDKIKILYLGVFLLLCIISFSILVDPIQRIFHETDFLWMMPTLAHISQHNSFWGTVKILFFDPAPTNYGEPSMNLYLFLIYYFIGVKVQYFVFISMIFHLFCVLFFYRILQRIGFSLQMAFLAALIYAFSFFHSFYFLWPMATQHLATMFFVLLIMYLFLETNYRFDHGLPWKAIFWQTLIVNLLASFCPITILVLPFMIFIYICCCSGGNIARIRKYDLWIPLFMTYFGYRLIRNIFWGDQVCYQNWYFSFLIKILSRIPILGKLTVSTGVEINPFVLFSTFFIVGTASLFLIRFILKISFKPSFLIFLKRMLLFGLISYGVLFLLTLKYRNIIVPMGVGIPMPDFISPYNFIRPLVGVFISFLNPVGAALTMNAAKPYCYVPMQSNIVWTVLFIFFLVVFFKKVYFKYKPLIFFVSIYIFGLPLLTMKSLWEMNNSIPSRYLVYVTPLFAVIFSSSVCLLYGFLMKKIKITAFKKEVILIVLFSALCFLNIYAIKLILAKDKFVNEFIIYDYIKGSNLIKYDLGESSNGVSFKDVCVKGVLPVPFLENGWDFSPANPLDLDTFKYTFSQVLNDRNALNVCVDSFRSSKNKKVYIFDDVGVINQEGQAIDPFLTVFYKARKELKLKNYQQARILLKEAVRIRPFFFRFILPDRPLEQILLMTNDRSAYAFVKDVVRNYNSENVNVRIKKIEYIANMLDREMKDYAECFFYLSYLSYLEKNLPESHYWYSRIRFVDDRKGEVLKYLSQQALIESDPKMRRYIEEIRSNSSYNNWS